MVSQVSPAPKTPARRTRLEQQAETRASVIAAARRIFLERGFHGTSLAAVATEAGFTKGAVYSNFESKTQLGLAVLAEIENENVMRLGRLLAGVDDATERGRVLTAWGEELLRDIGVIRLRGEINTVALDDPELAAQLAQKSRAGRAVVAQMLRTLPTVGDFLLDPDLLADTLVALSNGVGMMRLLDPETDLRAFVWAAGALTGYPIPRGDADDKERL